MSDPQDAMQPYQPRTLREIAQNEGRQEAQFWVAEPGRQGVLMTLDDIRERGAAGLLTSETMIQVGGQWRNLDEYMTVHEAVRSELKQSFMANLAGFRAPRRCRTNTGKETAFGDGHPFYVLDRNVQTGPFALEDVIEGCRIGYYTPNAIVRREDLQQWVTMREILQELAVLLREEKDARMLDAGTRFIALLDEQEKQTSPHLRGRGCLIVFVGLSGLTAALHWLL